MFLVDSHCHLDAINYDKAQTTVEEILSGAGKNQVGHVLTVSTTLSGFEKLHDWLGNRDDVSISCGVHPLELEKNPFNADLFWAAANNEAAIALGETGLDYYYQAENKKIQQQVFAEHLTAAKSLKKPVIIHMRQANNDTISLLKDFDVVDFGAVLHCFTEDISTARKLLDLGLYISFSGIVTFKNAVDLREAAKFVPVERMLIETDSPYLAPVPFRGKENQPAFVRYVAEFLATLKQIELDEFARKTTENFGQLFKVKLP